MSKAKKTWEFGFAVENLTEEAADRIVDAFIAAVEKEGAVCGGGCHIVTQQ